MGNLSAEFTPESVITAIGVLCTTLVGLYFAARMTAGNSQHLMRNLGISIAMTVGVQILLLVALMFWLVIPGFFFVICGLGTVIIGFYILIDLIYIMSPDIMSADDYILGALMLYVDIMRMLYYLLILFGSQK